MTPNLLIVISILLLLISTPLGSSFVFFFRKKLSPKLKDIIMGFTGGVMVTAAFFGLLLPSIEESQASDLYSSFAFLPPVIGFMVGGVILWLMDKFIPHIHVSSGRQEGSESKSMSEELKFFFAVLIHNIPEGMAVGIAAGLAYSSQDISAAMATLSLAIGISIQNIPEGAAVSIPLYGEGMSRGKAFAFGATSALVEPIFAVGALFLGTISFLTPWLLGVAAGAMFYVTMDEIMPDARKHGYPHHGIWAFMIGFAIMTILEIAL